MLSAHPKSDMERKLQVSIAKDYLVVYATLDELIAITDELVKLARLKFDLEQKG